jgi:hypothetical protein
MLDRHIEEWSEYRIKDKFRAIVVDDGSSKDPALDHLGGVDVGFPIELYRINVDIPWNQDGARNLGMHHADGWCLITDMDHLLNVKNAKKLATREVDQTLYYTLQRELQGGERYHPHPNTYFLTRDTYWKAGGYDESFRGYYGSDSVFQRQLEDTAETHKLPIALTLFKRDDIADASTTNYGRKNTEYHIANNPDLLLRRKTCPGPIPPLNFDWERLL